MIHDVSDNPSHVGARAGRPPLAAGLSAATSRTSAVPPSRVIPKDCPSASLRNAKTCPNGTLRIINGI